MNAQEGLGFRSGLGLFVWLCLGVPLPMAVTSPNMAVVYHAECSARSMSCVRVASLRLSLERSIPAFMLVSVFFSRERPCPEQSRSSCAIRAYFVIFLFPPASVSVPHYSFFFFAIFPIFSEYTIFDIFPSCAPRNVFTHVRRVCLFSFVKQEPGGAWRHRWPSLELFSTRKWSSLPGYPMFANAACEDGYPTTGEMAM